MAILEHEQRRWKAVLVFQTHMGQMPGKLRFRWTGPYWIIGAENGTFELGTLTGEGLCQKVNGFQLKSYLGPMLPNSFRADKYNPAVCLAEWNGH